MRFFFKIFLRKFLEIFLKKAQAVSVIPELKSFRQFLRREL